MYSSDGLDLPGLWSKKLRVLEKSLLAVYLDGALTIIPFTVERRLRQWDDFSAMARSEALSNERARCSIGA
jgi:hypothetical protein